MNKQTIRETIEIITHLCDGPLTRFVLISRAVDQQTKGVPSDKVAEALYMAMVECGFMEPDSDPDNSINTAD